MSKYSCIAVLCAILLAPMAMADQIVLKNGDRLTGSIVKSDAKTLTIKSEFAGDRYISNPLVGLKSNDVLLSTGLRLTFGR